MRTTYPIIIGLAVLLSEGVAAAAAPADTVALGELLVTAPHKTEVALTPLDVTVVTSGQIDKSTESSLLPVLMQHVPGLFVAERGFAGYGVSGGAINSTNIRGVGDGNKVLFMIDGQPQWAGIFGHALSDTYVANGVERVEVVKGPSSLLYGSSAMGGSVNIITRHQKEEGFSGSARAMFGSFSTQKFNLSTGYRHGNFSALVAGQVDRSNGNRDGNDYWLANELIQLQYAFSHHWTAGATVDLTQTHDNWTGTTYSPLENRWSDVFRGTSAIYVKNAYGKVNGGVQAYLNWGHHNLDDGNKPGADPLPYLFDSHDYVMGFTIFETVNPWQGNNLSAGIDFQHWGGSCYQYFKDDPSRHRDNSDYDSHVNEIAGYVMMQQSFLHDILNVNAGVRLQHGSDYGNVLVPQAGFIVHPVTSADIKFSFGKGFRAPTMRELYMYPPQNPDLHPEYMYNYELSYSQTLLGGRLNIGAALYFIDGKDMIQTQITDGKPLNVNTGNFINKGFELQGAWIIGREWNVSANYAYLHTSNNSLLYAPKNKLDAAVSFNPRNFEFTLENSNVWSLSTGNPDSCSSYSLLNFRAAYTMSAKVNLTYFVKLDNITDRHYEVVYGCPMPGITIMGGVRLSF